MENTWIEEFHYHEHRPELGLPPAWHLRIGYMLDTPEGPKPYVGDVLTMERAKELGFDLPRLLATMDANVLAAFEALNGSHETLKDKHRTMKEKKDALRVRLDAAKADILMKDREYVQRILDVAEVPLQQSTR